MVVAIARQSAFLAVVVGLAAQEEPAPRAHIEGQVVDAAGVPVRAADVWVERHGEVLARSHSDGLGTFVFPELPFDLLTVRAATRDLAGVVRVAFDAGERAFTCVRAFPARTLRVTVRAADGSPAPGIEVVAQPVRTHDLAHAVVRGTTDAEGRCTLHGVPIGEGIVRAHLPGRIVAEAEVHGALPQEVVLQAEDEPARHLTLALLGASPEQLRAARFLLQCERREQYAALPSHLELLPAGGGEVTVDDLPEGLRVRVAVAGLPGVAIEPAIDFVPAFARAWRLAFRVLPAAEGLLTGRLVDRDGSGLPRRRFICLPQRARDTWFWAVWGRTDEDGAFRVPSPVARGEKFVLRLADDRTVVGAGDDGAGLRTSVYTGRHDPAVVHRVVGVPACQLAGRVLDRSATPVPGAAVVVVMRDSHLPLARTFSGPGGRYELSVPEAVLGTVRVAVLAPAGSTAGSPPLAGDGQRIAMPDLVLGEPAAMRGRATWPDGMPAAGVVVDLYSLGEPWAAAWTLTDPDGAFVLPSLWPGRYRFAADRSGMHHVAAGQTLEVAVQVPR